MVFLLQFYKIDIAISGDRFLAFERMERTDERKLIGVCVANKVWPWMIDELEEWAHYTASPPERHRMYFSAHCLKSPGLFKKYNVDYIYDVSISCGRASARIIMTGFSYW